MIVPTILTTDLALVQKRLLLLANQVSRVQIDIIDGRFTTNQTVLLSDLLELIKRKNILFDFHLMVDNPVVFLNQDWPKTTSQITGQIELMASQLEFVKTVKTKGFLAGLALDLETEITSLEAMALGLADQVLLLGVKAGFSGQNFNPLVLSKIKELLAWREQEKWSFKVGLDGGINETNLVLCAKMGVDEFFVGSAIWKNKNPLEAIKGLEKARQKQRK